MKLAKEQEVLLILLVTLDGYRLKEGYENENLWEVSCDLALDESGYDLREKVKDLRVLADAGMIKFVYDEDLEMEDGEEDLYDQIDGIWLMDAGRRYIARLEEPLFKRLAGEAWDSTKGWFKSLNINLDSLIKIEINGIKISDIDFG